MNLKVYIPFLIALGLLTVVIIIDRDSFTRMKEYTAQVDRTRELINRLERLSNYFKSAQIYSPSAAQTAPRQYYQLYKQEADQIHQGLEQLRLLVQPDPIQKNRLNLITRLINKHWTVVLQNNTAQLIAAGEGWRFNDLFRVHQLINQSIAYENALLKTRQQELTRWTDQTHTLSNLFSILALGILLATFWENRALSRRRKVMRGFLESILNTSPNGIVNLQAIREQNRIVDFKVTYANSAVNDLLRLDSGEVTNQRLSSLPGLIQDSDFIDRLINVMTTGQSEPFELGYKISDQTVWLYVVMARHERGVTATFQDITPLKRYQQELQTKIHELDRSNKSLQQFAYIASHDLQEPLRKVQQFGDLLQQQYGPKLGEGVGYLQRMQVAASRMSTLINDLLSYSRTSTRQQEMTLVSLTEVARDVLKDLELLVEETSAVVQVAPLPTVKGDALQLRQLFQNLFSNALKFHHKNTAPFISVNTGLVAFNDLPRSVKPARRATLYQRIDVSDNGIGFDEKYLDRIFQVFQRLHSKDKFNGTGIGLAICEQVVTNHGGAITAISQPGHGATFSVYLPL